MAKYLFAFLLLFHGWIHLLGFLKAFNLGRVKLFKNHIPKGLGILWIFAGLMFIYLALAFLSNEDWYFDGFAFVILSQFLIFIFWKEAKAASIINLLVFSVALVQFGTSRLENTYRQDVTSGLEKMKMEEVVVTNEDLEHLPTPVANYLKYVGVLGEPIIQNVRIELNGEMRQEKGGWFSFTSDQHNFYGESPSRLFLMKAKMSSLPAIGYHSYQQDESRMLIKLMSLFPVVDEDSNELFQAETVTLFNELCLFSPSALLDKNIKWEAINDTTSNATYSNQGVTISATLYFNNDHQLINFVSDDRFDLSGGEAEKYRFSTPVGEYKNFNGYNIPTYAELIWHYPQEDFTYGKVFLQNIEFNVKKE